MEAIGNWTREHFLSNQAACQQKLSEDLTAEEKVSLRSNLNFKESGKLVLINHFIVSDIRETEFYCEKYEVKKASDDGARVEEGKYADKLHILDDEICENPTENLAERQVCIVSKSDTNNPWIKEFESYSINANKRKIEDESEQKTFLVKVYDNTEILLNDIIEILGFLYPTPQYSSGSSMENDEFNEEYSHLPRYTIHAVAFKKMPHNNPLLLLEPADEEMAGVEDLQKDLLKMLTQVLFGDELGAHYLLCHLISHVYSRVNDEALGKFTLNLICHALPAEAMRECGKKIYSLLEMLVPNSLYLPMTIENLNTMDFVPKKDYVTNKLSSGVLQLPKSTHLLLDETKLENGKLDNSGCMAVSHFEELIRAQQLSYDFQFYKIPYKTDIPVLIVSEGKSLLPSDFALPIKVSDSDSVRLINENFAAAMHCLRPKLNSFRRYLTKCRLQNFDIGEEETKMIEADFIKLRERPNFQIEDLHSLLVISRLLGISRGVTRLDSSSWETAKRMEAERSERMERRNAAAANEL